MRWSGDKWSIQRFRGYFRSEEAHICCSDRNETGTQKEKPKATSDAKSKNLLVFFDENRKLNAKKRKIRKTQWTPEPKTNIFWHKNRKTDLKKIQNRYTKKPNTRKCWAYRILTWLVWEERVVALLQK